MNDSTVALLTETWFNKGNKKTKGRPPKIRAREGHNNDKAR